MSVKFENTPYLKVIKGNNPPNNEINIFNCAKEELQFKYGNVSRQAFNAEYSQEGWLKRKVTVLPAAVSSAVKAIYHFAQAVLIRISKKPDQGHLQRQIFYAVRNFQTSYGNLISFFNDRYGQFYVQESQFQQACYVRQQLYDKLNKTLINKILNSDDYTSSEKEQLIHAAEMAYTVQGRLISETDWTNPMITALYLKWLAMKNPFFSSPETVQYEDKTLANHIDQLLVALPAGKNNQNTGIYGYPIRVHGNHRAGFVIDIDNRTVEYFNSFGDDSSFKEPLTLLAEALSTKYDVTFKYHHPTENLSLQKGGYQCGIWTCKLIEERVKQGKNFDPASLIDFNIAEYRNEVYAKVFKYCFFESVGRARYYAYLRQNVDGNGTEEELIAKDQELDEKICLLLKKNLLFSGSYKTSSDIDIAANTLIDSSIVEWGRKSQIPSLIQNLVQQVKK